MNDDPHVLFGAYILGGLDAGERRQFEAHLRECPQCRRDVADCAEVPALLAKVDPADLDYDDTPGVVDGRYSEPQRNTRHWWRSGAVLAGAAAIALTVGIASVTIFGQSAGPSTHTYAVQEVTGDVAGVVTLTPKPWGTAISLDLEKLPHQGVFTLRTMDGHGRMQPAANWAGMPTGRGVVEGATSIPMPELRTLSVVDTNDTVLATLQR
ncbi:zf-HC2 domain-containing protein [Mycobacterium sp. 21AC1]|uniref:zf-HC2 domain-containing protein n=1 Tax=[Mycobacterium] appelbergii TaxID=2939269 RepID=UPI0029392ADC|nr:zf-HC2 domain-containing protein [Mycobacterium sp. 21AC1]MDV3126603.1 zf-HC2 domain-containing protein [Mycobacterium sp. 21AC1]